MSINTHSECVPDTIFENFYVFVANSVAPYSRRAVVKPGRAISAPVAGGAGPPTHLCKIILKIGRSLLLEGACSELLLVPVVVMTPEKVGHFGLGDVQVISRGETDVTNVVICGSGTSTRVRDLVR